MKDRSYFIEAALRYEELLESGQVIGLDAFVVNEPAEVREELRAFLEFNLMLGELDAPVALTPEEEATADRVMALARAALERELSGEPVQNLTGLRKAQQLTVGRLARQLTLPVDLLARLERGKVHVATIPERLIERLAEALQTTTSIIQAALLAPPPVSAEARLSAEDGIIEPDEAVVSFAQAFADSAPTDKERAAWADVLPNVRR
ncbi:helix-turn-helix domain-containing protein [Roseiflexus sp.]|uniref:helix-turn-helix domain-containing protein n=1 Tax=Roseiflexus sp. TaxID=2562120 RepID=UPI00398B40BC